MKMSYSTIPYLIFLNSGWVSSVPFRFLFLFQLHALRTSKFRNQFTISSKYFDMACYLKRENYSGPISFEVQQNDINDINHLRCHPSSTALGTRTGY